MPWFYNVNSKLFDEKTLIETIKYNSLDSLQLDLIVVEILEYTINTDLKFIINKKPNNTKYDLNASALAINPDNEVADNQISYIIMHTEYQLANVIKKSNINLAYIVLRLHDEMMNDKKLALRNIEDQSIFWATYHKF